MIHDQNMAKKQKSFIAVYDDDNDYSHHHRIKILFTLQSINSFFIPEHLPMLQNYDL